MKIEQFEDKGLAHFSYAVLGECAREIVRSRKVQVGGVFDLGEAVKIFPALGLA